MKVNSSNNSIQSGTLYVVGTPIGNLSDLSFRAVNILKKVDYIACENNRITKKLLNHINSNKPTLSYWDKNECQKTIILIQKIKAGKSIALVVDAGTPTVSDPGFRIVRECRRKKLPIVPIPGPCALIVALSASGLPTNSFLFVGFLPPKKSARKNFFKKYKDFEYTIIIYESCHRIIKFILDLLSVLGENRIICICREITKLHENYLIGTASKVASDIMNKNKKGEFVVLIAPKTFEL